MWAGDLAANSLLHGETSKSCMLAQGLAVRFQRSQDNGRASDFKMGQPPSSKYKFCVRCADEESRKNYEKYGHPDGPQALNMGIALPEWIFRQAA